MMSVERPQCPTEPSPMPFRQRPTRVTLSRSRAARQASPSSVPDACQGPGLCELPSHHALCSAMLDLLARRIF